MSKAINLPEPGWFERDVFIPNWLGEPELADDWDVSEDIIACSLCAFRSLSFASVLRHEQQEHS